MLSAKYNITASDYASGIYRCHGCGCVWWQNILGPQLQSATEHTTPIQSDTEQQSETELQGHELRDRDMNIDGTHMGRGEG